MLRPTLVLALLVPLTVAASSVREKAAARRAQAQELVDDVIGGDNPQGAVSRLKYLGEERYAAVELSDTYRRTSDPRARRNLLMALSLLAHPEAEEAFLKSLQDDDAATRMYAAQGLGRIRSKRMDAVVPLLSDKTLGVRKEAARALGASGNPKYGKALIQAARAEGEPEARIPMLVAVGESGDKKQIKAIETFLDSSSESTRFAAAQALCRLGAPKGFAFARRLLASQDRLERDQGVALLEGTRARQAGPLLKPMLDDPDRRVAAHAARVLYQGGDASMLRWLVLASYRAPLDEKLVYEKELETLRLADDQRKAILAREGIK